MFLQYKNNKSPSHKYLLASRYMRENIYIIIILPLLFFTSYAKAEYFDCYIGTSGLTKSDFQFLYVNYTKEQEVSTDNIIVSEIPEFSGNYKISGLESIVGSYYYFQVKYNNVIYCEYRYPLKAGLLAEASVCSDYQISKPSKLVWKSGDTKPNLTINVTGFPQDPSLMTCTFNAYSKNLSITGTCNIQATQQGDTWNLTLTYVWSATDLKVETGKKSTQWIAQFTLTDGTNIYTIPPDNSLVYIVLSKENVW